MSSSAPNSNSFRVLVIDDDPGIHEDIRKILTVSQNSALEKLEQEVLDTKAPVGPPMAQFEIDSAFQGEEGVECVRRAREENRPYALVFLDMRMPPGIDGRETIAKLWNIDSDLQVVICTAFSDYTWQQIAATTGSTTRVVILKKPFEPIEVLQLAHALTEKWLQEQGTRRFIGELENLVVERTQVLEDAQTVLHLIVEETIENAKRRP